MLRRSLDDGAWVAARLWRRRHVFAAVAALVLGGLLWVIAGLEKVYSASAMVMLDRPDVAALSDRIEDWSTDPFSVRSEVDLLWSLVVAERAVRDMDLVDEPAFAPEAASGGLSGLVDRFLGGGDGDDAEAVAASPAAGREMRVRSVVEDYLDHLRVFNDGRSLAVMISFEASTPELAARLANGHAQAYLAIKSEALSSSYAGAAELLRDEIDRSMAELGAAEEATAAFLNDHPVLLRSGGDEATASVEPTISQTRAFVEDTKRRSAEIEATLDELDRGRDAGGIPSSLQSPALDLMRQQEAQDLLRLRQLEATSGDNPGMSDPVQLQLAATRNAIGDEVARLTEGLRSELEVERRTLARLESLVDAAVAERTEFNTANAEYRGMMLDIDTRRAGLEALLQRQDNLRLASGILGADATLVSPAVPPLRPSFPRIKVLSLLALIVALAAGAGVALLADALAARRLTASEIARRLGVPDLAVVPLGPGRTAGRLRNPRTWRELRYCMTYLDMLRGDEHLVIGITGSVRADQRTAVAVGLARCFATAQRRVLLVNLDASATAGDTILPAANASVGLIDHLRGGRGQRGSDPVIVNAGQTHMDVLPLGGLAAGARFPAEVLSSRGFGPLIDRLREDYDRVILLLPDPESGAEFGSTAQQADLIVAVAEVSRRDLERLRALKELLLRLYLPLDGLIAVRWERERGRRAGPAVGDLDAVGATTSTPLMPAAPATARDGLRASD